MNWINETFGTEFSAEIQLGIMFAALLVALLIIIWLFRKVFGSAGSRVARNRQPRLGVVEAAIVDDNRRLVLVRRDNVEHLLMIGGPGDVVVENNIRRESQGQTQIQQQAPAQRATAPGHGTPETTPREPRLIEPAADSSPDVAAPQQKSREIIPPAETAAAAATGAAAAVVASETAHAAEEEAKATVEKPAIEEPALKAPPADAGTEEADTASAAEELARELTGDLDVAADEPMADTDGSASPEVQAEDGETDTEEDMQKLLDELAGGKN